MHRFRKFLLKQGRKEVLEMLYKYREAFSLRDEIGLCPNIEVEVDVTDRFPFYKTVTMLERRTRLLLIKK